MKVIVKPHKIKIELEHDYNSGEYNVQECNFEFSDEYTGLSKVVIFSNSNVTKEIQIYDDKCIVPAEVLQNEGVVGIGVYGYEVSGDELTLRYSPKPQCFSVEKGSYAEGTQPTPPTPSVVEQLQQQITNNANNISSLQNLTASQGEQIETNTNDISAIKSEQTTQNNKIQANTEEIQSINGIIPTLAKKTEIPTKVSQLENDSNYVTETEMSNAIDEEKTERENADIELQSQIDAITVSSDVVDVVGTYQELLDYDTSKLTDDDIIKVLVDSTHNDALSYYRWQITGGIGSWQYVGSEGPFYTKSETDSLLNEKQDEITNDNKLDSDLVSDIGQTNKFVTVQEKNTWNNKQDALTFDNTPTENSNNPAKSGGIYDFVNTKLEDYVLETDFEESQSLQDNEIARNKMIYNAMPKVSGEGTDLTLNNTAECPVYDIELSPSALEQETTTGKNKFSGDYLQFDSTGGTGTTYGYFKLPDDGDYYTLTLIAKNDFTIPANTYLGFTGNGGDANNGYEWVIQSTLGSVTKGTVLTYSSNSLRYISLYSNSSSKLNTITTNFYVQLEKSENFTSYEEYTGGQPSPNPQYPQQIHTVSGDNSVKVENSNIFDGVMESGIIDGRTGQNASISGYIRSKNYIPVEELTNYVFSTDDIIGQRILVYEYKDNFSYNLTNNKSVYYGETYTTEADTKYIRFRPFYTIEDLTIKFWINKGTTALPYTPHQEQSLPLSLGNLEYCKIGNYEDLFFKNVVGSKYYDSTLELDKWYLKKNINKVIFNGSENWTIYGTGTESWQYRLINTTNVASNSTGKSNYYPYASIGGTGTAQGIGVTGGSFRIRYGTEDTVENFKTWLSTHNVELYYQLATPTNILLNNTLQTQLDNLAKAISYQDQTNVSQINADLPFVIKMSAIRDLSGIFELIQ